MINKGFLIESLNELGLSQIESKIYSNLIFKGPQSILEISRELHIPRTSVYDSTLKLLENGLIEQIIFYKTQKYQVASLDILDEQIKRKQEKIASLAKITPEINKLISEQEHFNLETKVRYYHGKQGFMQMMWNSLNAKKETVGYSEFGRIDIVGNKFRQQYLDETIKKGIRDRVITNKEHYSNAYILKYPNLINNDKIEQIRIIDKNQLSIKGDIMIYNNIYAISYWKNKEITGIEIENEEFVKMQKAIFEIHWKITKQLKAIETT